MEELYNSFVVYPKFGNDEDCKDQPLKSNRDVGCIEEAKQKGEAFWSMDATTDMLTIDDYFDAFYDRFKFHQSLAVDGPSGCGKSSMINKYKPLKVNGFVNIQEDNSYNIFPANALPYIFINLKIAETENAISDRSAISNFAYFITYFIMNAITSNLYPGHTLHGICDIMVNLHNLKPFLEFIKPHMQKNTLILMDSSFEHNARRINKRGRLTSSISDIAKSICYEYFISQIAAFSYLANILEIPCIDINYVRTKFYIDDDSKIFEANSRAFNKVNILDNDCIVDVAYERTNGSNFMKELQKHVIDISRR
ncbi:guanosine monophosphate kinase [Penaeus vannamei nudivirus]|nr:guanosine monophosphate kinase [Penaeus vannamei nucleopolyhedrovirus]